MKFLKLAAVAVAGLSLAGCSLLYPHWGATTFPSDGPTSSSSASAIPTQSSSATPTPSSKPVQAAKVVILQNNVDATAGVIDVVAQVSNVAEDGGQCTLTVVSGNTTKSQTVRAESNVDSTQCYPMEVSLAGLAKGSASMTVTYKSAGYVGTSVPQVFNN